MATKRLVDIKTCKHGVTDVTSVQEVSWDTETAEIAASGDDDAVDTFLAKGKTTVRGSITLQDPIQATALLAVAAAADLVFKGRPGLGDTKTATVTISDVIFFSNRARASHGGVHTQTLSFRGFGATLPAVVEDP